MPDIIMDDPTVKNPSIPSGLTDDQNPTGMDATPRGAAPGVIPGGEEAQVGSTTVETEDGILVAAETEPGPLVSLPQTTPAHTDLHRTDQGVVAPTPPANLSGFIGGPNE